jgi:hypothetical protein
MSDSLLAIGNLRDAAERLRERIATGEALLKDLKEQYRIHMEELLPGAMEEAGFSECTLADGTEISVAPSIHPSLSEKTKPEAYRWLKEVAHLEALFKHTVTITIPKDPEAAARVMMIKSAVSNYVKPEQVVVKEDVHASTLKSALRKLIEDGKPVPFETFGIYARSVATIKPPKD